MSSLLIQSSTHDYEVAIGSGIRNRVEEILEKEYQKVLIITDSQVADLYLQQVKEGFSAKVQVGTAVVPAGEASKSMELYQYLLDMCVEERLDRQSLIIALGGGMIGDLAGFAASTYLRGIDFVQMPTTILAHDSSVGGKVAINHPQGKNLIGSFYNPVHVIYDMETLSSLSPAEVRSGYGEVVKHALLSDPKWLDELLQQDLTQLSKDQIAKDLAKGIRVKANLVEQDEREAGVRKYLNLGHTLAHAIEAELGYGDITHGEAVAIGIWFALKLSKKKFQTDLPTKDYVNWIIQNHFPVDKLNKLDSTALINRMKRDKKTVHEVINYVLLTDTGFPCIEPLQDEELLQELNDFLKEVRRHD